MSKRKCGKRTAKTVPSTSTRRAPEVTSAVSGPGDDKPVRLHLGCGYKILDGYINIDLYSPAADLKLDITDLSSFADDSVDEIYLNAVFEHLYIFEQRKALSEWRRVLKPGGILRIDSIPDFDETVRAYINRAPGNGGGVFDIEEVSRYTHGAYANHDKLGQIHKDVFNKEKVRNLLEGAGFEVESLESTCWGQEPNPVNLNARAVKKAAASLAPRPTPAVSDEEFRARFAPLVTAPKPRFAAVYCVYDDAAWLAESVESVYGCCSGVYVLVSDRPWNGDVGDCSETLELVENLPDPENKVRLVRGSWSTEADQRNAGLDMLSEAGYEYCLVIDADELYDPTDLARMMELASRNPQVHCWHASMDTYWKSWRYRIDPREPLKPAVFVKVGGARFTENRNVSECTHGLIPAEIGFCHHLSYARTDDQLLRKISTFSHADEIREGWYEKVWRRWDEDHGMRNLHPTHPSAYGRAVEQPLWAMPPVLRRLAENADASGFRAQPRTSIIILARNQVEYTKRCIESIQRWTPEPHEIIVVDNGSTDGTPDYLAQLAVSGQGCPETTGVRAIRSETNLGFAGGNNLGIEASTGDFVLLMNNDVVVTPGWLERMLACAARDPQIGIVGPVSNSVSGPQYVDQPLYDTDSLSGLDQFALEWSEKHSREVAPIWRVVGFCLLARRSVIERIGGLDTRFGMGNFEDDDFCIRAQVAGFKCVIARDSFVHHFGSRTFAGESVDYKALLERNWGIYKDKWGLPADLHYGAPYSLTQILGQPFDVRRHFCPLSEAPSLGTGVSQRFGTGVSRNNRGDDRGTISVCLIARNEEAFVGDCLRSVQGLADEIVVLDTGSTDSTVEIAESCGAKVYHYEWCEDYSAARNEAMKHATRDWILFLDADERLDPSAVETIRRAVRNPAVDAYELLFHNYCKTGGTTPDIVHRACRLHRNRSDYQYEGRIHENVVVSIARTGGVVEEIDALVHHYGYQPEIKQERNKHERYVKLLRAELDENPDNIYVLHHISAAHCAEKEFDEAIPYLRRTVEIIPPRHAYAGQTYSRLINALWATSRHEEALEVAEQARQRGVVHPEITFGEGNALLALDRYQEAVAAFEAAQRQGQSGEWLGDPGTYGFKARFGVARACVGLGDFRRAAQLCRDVVAEQPNHSHAHQLLALSCEQAGLLEDALSEWNEVLRLAPDSPQAKAHLPLVLDSLGSAYAEQGRQQEALDCFTRLIEMDQENANAYFNAGDVLYSAGQYDDAAEFYQAGLRLKPDHAPGFFTLGNCCFQVGAYEAAAAAYRQALEIDPDYSEAASNLSLVADVLERQAA